jgi:16S rRNA (cytosine1402-N4)-methyltransferase
MMATEDSVVSTRPHDEAPPVASPHAPVLLREVVALLLPDGAPRARVIDGTLGAAGHARALLDAGAESLLGFDLDPAALALARAALSPYGARAQVVQASYATMTEHAARVGWGDGVDAILLDLGVSSMQLDTPERGFAFRHDGPLDMRFDPTGDRPTAAELVNTWGEDELATLFFRYGEDPDARRLARAVVAGRPFATTRQLAEALEAAARKPRGRDKRGANTRTIHPATRAFQALRIAVNDELGVVERALPLAIDLLRPGGRLAVISFHSLEDRLAKQIFRDASTEIVSPPGMQLAEKRAVVKLITRKPIVADDDEARANPRSRSAKLRAVEKL